MIDIPGSPFASIGQLLIGMDAAMLTTLDSRGSLRSRPMMVQRFEAECCLWFLTVRTSQMVEEIRDHPQVNVSLMSPVESLYVSVAGMALLIEDRDEIRALWKPSYTMWFPAGPEDPDLVLLKMQIEDAEYWKSPAGAALQVYGLVRVVGNESGSAQERPSQEFVTGVDDG